MTLTWRKQGSCGLVELNNPPVNAINRAIRQGLSEAVAWAESQQLSRVILSGAGGVFAAGADAGEFDTPPEAPHLPDVLQQIETSPLPWIAALHGAVLGGGAELALGNRKNDLSLPIRDAKYSRATSSNVYVPRMLV